MQLIDNTGDVTIVTMVRSWFDYGPWIQMSKESLNLMELAVTCEVANELRFTMLGSRDPVDWFLVATAKVYDFDAGDGR